MEGNCIFCQIVSGAIPSRRIYEDDQVLAFLDIRPVSAGHTLVIPKEHYRNLEEIDPASLARLIQAVQAVGRIIKDKLGVAGYNVTENNDPVAGQEVPHLHFHVIPRQPGDNLGPWPHREYAPGEAEEILRKLTS